MSPVVGLFLVLALIAANAAFVAAEFALVSSRRSVIDQLAEEGVRGARAASDSLGRLSFILSAAQFGITVTTLLVGLLAEDTVGALLSPLLDLTGLPEATATGLSVFLAFLLSTMVQMVFGELAPKNLAIALPEKTSLRTAGFMRGFGILFGPIISFFDGGAAWVCRMLGIEVRHELETGYEADELTRIVQASGESGSLTPDQTALLTRGIGLGDRRVAELVVPRPDVIWLERDDTLEDLRRLARSTGHSRFPVRGEDDDDILGSVHIKDLLGHDDPAAVRIGDVVTPTLVVPEGETARDLLRQFRTQARTFAVVVDEYGGTAGIVTIEDVVEELVGEIADEHDTDTPLVRRIGARRYRVAGSLRADRLPVQVGLTIPEGDYETIAGFVLHVLGRIPEPGERFEHEGWQVEVAKVDGVRVSELLLERPTLAATEEVAP